VQHSSLLIGVNRWMGPVFAAGSLYAVSMGCSNHRLACLPSSCRLLDALLLRRCLQATMLPVAGSGLTW
jgi:hypothetical protein